MSKIIFGAEIEVEVRDNIDDNIVSIVDIIDNRNIRIMGDGSLRNGFELVTPTYKCCWPNDPMKDTETALWEAFNEIDRKFDVTPSPFAGIHFNLSIPDCAEYRYRQILNFILLWHIHEGEIAVRDRKFNSFCPRLSESILSLSDPLKYIENAELSSDMHMNVLYWMNSGSRYKNIALRDVGTHLERLEIRQLPTLTPLVRNVEEILGTARLSSSFMRVAERYTMMEILDLRHFQDDQFVRSIGRDHPCKEEIPMAKILKRSIQSFIEDAETLVLQ